MDALTVMTAFGEPTVSENVHPDVQMEHATMTEHALVNKTTCIWMNRVQHVLPVTFGQQMDVLNVVMVVVQARVTI